MPLPPSMIEKCMAFFDCVKERLAKTVETRKHFI